MKVCSALRDDGSAWVWFFYMASTEDLSENSFLDGNRRWDLGADRRGNVFPKIWEFSFLKK